MNCNQEEYTKDSWKPSNRAYIGSYYVVVLFKKGALYYTKKGDLWVRCNLPATPS